MLYILPGESFPGTESVSSGSNSRFVSSNLSLYFIILSFGRELVDYLCMLDLFSEISGRSLFDESFIIYFDSELGS